MTRFYFRPPQVDNPSNDSDSGLNTKCVWCSQTLALSDSPKLLECLHVSCDTCLKTKFAGATSVQCPICCMVNQLDLIIDNQFLIEQITSTEEAAQNAASVPETDTKTIKCSSCSDDATATSWCVECSEYICDNCVQAHQRLKITKDHTIKPKEEANAESPEIGGGDKNIMCPTHVQEKLSLFCETCDKLTCRDCQLVDHRDHKYKFAVEIAADTRNTLTSLLGEISYKRVLLTSAMKVIDDRQSLISEKKKESIREIKNMVMKITNAINMRSKILVMRLNEVCDSKLRVLNEKKIALQQLSGHTDHCIDFVQIALDKGSDSAVLFSKKSLVKHLQQVKCQRADIPNPEIPVRIQVHLNGIPELQKEIAAMGTIIVDGKVFPSAPHPPRPQPTPPGQLSGPTQPPVNRQQPPSPNMAPLIRLGSMVPPVLPNQVPPPPCDGFQMYPGNPSPNQNFPNQNMGLNRQFSQEQRFPPNMMNRQGQGQGGGPLVSSSTHPQNIDMSLRSLLNNQAVGQATQQQQQQMQRMMQGPPVYGSGSGQNGGPPAPPAPPQSMSSQMRAHYGRMQSTPPGGYGPTSPANFMASNGSNGGPRFQGINNNCPPSCGPSPLRPPLQSVSESHGD